MSVTVNGSSGLTFNDGSSQATAATGFGFKNRIINGAMMIDQRNAGASVTSTTSNPYTLDRWQAIATVSSKYTIQQSSTAATGFINSLLVTSSAATTVGSGDVYILRQLVEGLNCADLGWGTANAQPVTLSFWVRSSLTGTFGGSFRNSASNRSYPFTYTISAANTWEQKTVTVAGDTSGTWLTTNGTGINISFGLGVGSTYSGTAGAWASADYASATGATSVVGTSGATFYITGVQLEKGSTATSFDYRPYGTELQLCRRYCAVNSCESKSFSIFINMTGIAQSGGTTLAGAVQFPQPMRSTPSLTPSGGFRASAYNTVFSTSNTPTIDSARVTTTGAEWALTGLSGMTAGYPYYLQATASADAKLIWSAEL